MPAKRRRSRKKTRRCRKDLAARGRSFEALRLMRSGLSLTQAAPRAHTTPETVRKYVGSALNRLSNGRYIATRSDRFTRRVWLLTPNGKVEIAVRGSRPASRVALHWAAVDRYLRDGDTEGLAEFKGQGVRSRNRTYPFLTDTKVLERLTHADEVSFERLYVLRA